MKQQKLKDRLLEIFKPIEKRLLELECDGSTRALSFLLYASGIKFETHVATLKGSKVALPIHYYLKIGEVFIDYGASHWFKDKAWPAVSIEEERSASSLSLIHGTEVEGFGADLLTFQILMPEVNHWFFIELLKELAKENELLQL